MTNSDFLEFPFVATKMVEFQSLHRIHCKYGTKCNWRLSAIACRLCASRALFWRNTIQPDYLKCPRLSENATPCKIYWHSRTANNTRIQQRQWNSVYLQLTENPITNEPLTPNLHLEHSTLWRVCMLAIQTRFVSREPSKFNPLKSLLFNQPKAKF